MRLNEVIDAAVDYLNEHYPRSRYAVDVITGHQAWSGSDLKGSARKWGAGYAKQRSIAESALRKAGGCVVAAGRYGTRKTAVRLCVDDFGTEVYEVQGFDVLLATEMKK